MHNYKDRLYILINLTDINHFDPPIYNDFFHQSLTFQSIIVLLFFYQL